MEKNKIVAGWSFTKACNLKCIHCYNYSGRMAQGELTLEESYKVADKLKEAGVVAVNFGGGECALRKDFIPLCRYLKKLEMKVSYTTNGTTFHLIKENLHLFDDVGVSIDFADKEKHDWFRGIEGTYDSAINTLEELVRKGVDTEIVTCLTSSNCSQKEMEALYNLAKKLKVTHWRINRFRKNGRGIQNANDLALTKNQLRKSYEFFYKKMEETSTKVSIPEPIFRSAFGGSYFVKGDPSGFSAFRIQPTGEVSPSVFLSTSGGNIKEKSVKEIMNSEIFKKIRDRKPNGKCKFCKFYTHCIGGDAGASYLELGHFNGPDPMCWINPKTRKNWPKVIKKEKGEWNVHELYLCTLYVPINDKNEISKYSFNK